MVSGTPDILYAEIPILVNKLFFLNTSGLKDLGSSALSMCPGRYRGGRGDLEEEFCPNSMSKFCCGGKL